MIYKDFILALKGRHQWRWIKQTYDIGEGVLVLLMTAHNDKINYYALKYLDYYRKKKYLERVVILTDYDRIQEYQRKMKVKHTDIVRLSKSKCREIQKYYQLQSFHASFLMVSIDEPAGNTVGGMLKSGKMTEEELLLGSIYI